ncbi:MAG: HAD family hydrolase [Nitrososphaerota archaeon]
MVDRHKPFQGVKAIIFDFDNTLVDSASVLRTVHLKVAEAMGRHLQSLNINVSVDEVADLIWKTEKEMEAQRIYDRDHIWERIMALYKAGTVPKNLFGEWTEIYWSHYNAPVFPEVEETLSTLLSLGYRLGMVTNTDGKPGFKKMRLQRYGLMRFFHAVVVAGDDVDEVKPSPKPFLKVSELLGVSPMECVMVGDHPVNDVLGSKDAGMKTVLIDRHGGGLDCPADIVIKSLSELLLVV